MKRWGAVATALPPAKLSAQRDDARGLGDLRDRALRFRLMKYITATLVLASVFLYLALRQPFAWPLAPAAAAP